MSLHKLIIEREVLDTKIRALRVRHLRQAVTTTMHEKIIVPPAKFRQACAVLEEIEDHIERVHYCKVVVDDLLEHAEGLMDIVESLEVRANGDMVHLQTP